jgi:antitoxin YefM
MATQVTYTQARSNLATLLDEVTDNREIITITRRNGENVAMIAEDELRSLLETSYLLRSPANAERLSKAIERSRKRQGKAMSIEDLRREVGLEQED